jgi:capsular polysaccharide transport system ATP-binding protein
MISVERLSKSYPTRAGSRTVLNQVDLQFTKGEKIGILGRNGSGKSTLIRLISGAERPTSGQIVRKMSVSWPLAFQGAFQLYLTGLDNFRFICRIYGVDPAPLVPFLEDFSELGAYLREPVHRYSSGMFARLSFAISMAIEFDCFLIDEIIVVGDSRFQEKCHVELFEKRRDRAMLLVSHNPDLIRHYCTRAAVLEGGTLRSFDSVDAAYTHYKEQTAHA